MMTKRDMRCYLISPAKVGLIDAYKRKKHSVSAVLSCSGTQDVSVAASRLLLILSVRSRCTQEICEGILCGLYE